MPVEIALTAAQPYEKSHLKWLAIENDLEGNSKSSAMTRLPHITIYYGP